MTEIVMVNTKPKIFHNKIGKLNKKIQKCMFSIENSSFTFWQNPCQNDAKTFESHTFCLCWFSKNFFVAKCKNTYLNKFPIYTADLSCESSTW